MTDISESGIEAAASALRKAMFAAGQSDDVTPWPEIVTAAIQAYLPFHPPAREEGLRDALEQIVQWADAYPLSAFPEPDFAVVRAALEEKGITLDAVSASNMRHAIDGVGKIAREALREQS